MKVNELRLSIPSQLKADSVLVDDYRIKRKTTVIGVLRVLFYNSVAQSISFLEVANLAVVLLTFPLYYIAGHFLGISNQ